MHKNEFNAWAFFKCYSPLFIITLFLSGMTALYTFIGISPPDDMIYLGSVLFPIGFATWVQRDARKRRRTPCFDFGTYIYFTWVISVPGYLLWSRGWKGVLLAAMFFCMAITPSLISIALWIAMYG